MQVGAILGKGTYGQVTICPDGACKSFFSPESFYHEASYSIYLAGLPGIVEIKEIDCPKQIIKMGIYESNLHIWMQKHPFDVTDYRAQIQSILDIAQGLDSLNTLGLLHGDLKPENILIKNDRAVLADFGNTGSPPYVDLELMTQFYAPPDEEATFSTDIYALGIIILEMWQPFPDYRVIPSRRQLKGLITQSLLPENLKKISLLCTNEWIGNRPSAKQIYLELSQIQLPCYFPEIPTKSSIYSIDSEDLCQVLKKLRDVAFDRGFKSYERTLALFQYLVGIRPISPSDYFDYVTAITYLYDQIINLRYSGDIQIYAGADAKRQLRILELACHILDEKRGIQILIQGY